MTISFPILGTFSTIISSKIFSVPFFFSSSSGIPVTQMLMYLILSQRSLRLSSILYILFSFILLLSSYFHHSSFSSHICSSALVILLLVPSRIFLISVIVLLISVSLFFYFFYVLGDCINGLNCFLHLLHSIFKSSEHLCYHYFDFSFRSIAYFLFVYLVL